MHSIREVAKQAGVSTATVSRAFNTPELISKLTRTRVLETADRLNYRPLRARAASTAPGLRAEGAATEAFIGFQFFGATSEDLLPANAFYAPILAAAQAEAAALGMHLLVNTTDRHQLANELPKMIRDKTVPGMLLVGTADPEVLAVFLERIPQIVLIDHRDPTGRHDCIISDGVGGALAATQYLLGLGHRRIGFLREDPAAPTFQDRQRGFVCAHFEAGCPLDPRMIVAVSTEAAIPAVMESLLKSPDRPSALIAANDRQAYFVMQACRTLGLEIPRDLSLIGFDDIEFSAHTWPPLTTVRVNTVQMGRVGVRQLHGRLQAAQNAQATMPPVTVEVPVSLIERQSCRPLTVH
jgi:DNA-binding LacI/PurR family transcriptional regulator